ncbi:MAG: hypothetical protein HY516_01345 [Candidatus Aenigmarchaeota archaeon]|nr:hypothetical protein [Candidatus Aenigmarchaeota archaeon]
MKAVTPVIALVMLLLVTTGLVGISYAWFSSTMSSQTSGTFKATPVGGNKVMITNIGTTDLDTNSLKVFAGSGEAGISNPTTIQPGKAAVLEIIPRGYGKIGGRVVSNSMSYDFTSDVACTWLAEFKQNDVVRFRWHNDCAEDGGMGLSNVNGGPSCSGCDDPTLTGITLKDRDGNAIGSWSGSLQTGDSLTPKVENRFIDLTVAQASSNGPFYADFSFASINRPQDQQFWLYSVNGIDKRTYLGDGGDELQIPCSKSFACINSITAGSALKLRVEHKSGGDYDNDLQPSCAYTEDTDDFQVRKIELVDQSNTVLAANSTAKWLSDVMNGAQNFDAYTYYLTVTQSSTNYPFKLMITDYDLSGAAAAEFDLIKINDGFAGYVGDIDGGGASVQYVSEKSICA